MGEEKGYGFIYSDETEAEDVSVHYNAGGDSGFRSLNAGERASYELTQGR